MKNKILNLMAIGGGTIILILLFAAGTYSLMTHLPLDLTSRASSVGFKASTHWEGDYMRVHWHGHAQNADATWEYKLRSDVADEWSDWKELELSGPASSSFWIGTGDEAKGYVERGQVYQVIVREAHNND